MSRRSRGPFLIVCGLEREASLARAPGRVTLVSGGDPARLRQRLGAVDPGAFGAVISFGVAGGLDPAAEAGAILVPETVVDQAGLRWSADRALAASLRDRIAGAFAGMLAGVDSPVLDVAAKAALRSRTGAMAVDMESHISAAFAAAHDLPFVVLRTITDPAARALPPLARVALGRDGRLVWRAIIASLCADPGQIALLPATARDARRGFWALRSAAEALPGREAGL